ncbi:MAG TPA: TauD/TfdA family dioxygenase [Ramlibacter sp.]|jgi:taurine dioxygenase|nr:TauD/TfdA family dioxygenase [Ramlibacter sp.]
MNFEVRPLASALGAEIVGLDMSRPVDEETQAQLRKAWLQHLVLLFRGQKLSPENLIAFSRRFAKPHTHENYESELRHPEHPEILLVKAREVAGRKTRFGEQWHSDMSFTTQPALASVLYARRMPPVGGDTCWANMYLAYETLSRPMQQFLEGLEVVHDLNFGKTHQDRPFELLAESRKRNPAVRQPAVRVHPETGRKALFVSEWACPQFVGMTREESQPILEMLFRHSTQPQFQFRQQWKPDDLLIWDNRCTVHLALGDYADFGARELMRTSLVGEASGAVLTKAEYAGAYQ